MEKNPETLFTIKCRPPFILTYFLTDVLKMFLLLLHVMKYYALAEFFVKLNLNFSQLTVVSDKNLGVSNFRQANPLAFPACTSTLGIVLRIVLHHPCRSQGTPVSTMTVFKSSDEISKPEVFASVYPPFRICEHPSRVFQCVMSILGTQRKMWFRLLEHLRGPSINPKIKWKSIHPTLFVKRRRINPITFTITSL